MSGHVSHTQDTHRQLRTLPRFMARVLRCVLSNQDFCATVTHVRTRARCGGGEQG